MNAVEKLKIKRTPTSAKRLISVIASMDTSVEFVIVQGQLEDTCFLGVRVTNESLTKFFAELSAEVSQLLKLREPKGAQEIADQVQSCRAEIIDGSKVIVFDRAPIDCVKCDKR